MNTPTISDKGSSAVETGEGLGSSAARIPTAQTADVAGHDTRVGLQVSDKYLDFLATTYANAMDEERWNAFTSVATLFVIEILDARKAFYAPTAPGEPR